MPIRNESFAVARALAVLLLPASLADVGAAECGFIVKQQRVINLFVLKVFAASFARVSAALNVPLGHENGLNQSFGCRIPPTVVCESEPSKPRVPIRKLPL